MGQGFTLLSPQVKDMDRTRGASGMVGQGDGNANQRKPLKMDRQDNPGGRIGLSVCISSVFFNASYVLQLTLYVRLIMCMLFKLCYNIRFHRPVLP